MFRHKLVYFAHVVTSFLHLIGAYNAQQHTLSLPVPSPKKTSADPATHTGYSCLQESHKLTLFPITEPSISFITIFISSPLSRCTLAPTLSIQTSAIFVGHALPGCIRLQMIIRSHQSSDVQNRILSSCHPLIRFWQFAPCHD